MYPSRFKYESPKSIEEAIALLTKGNGEAKILAGGMSLIPMMKLRFASPETLIDISNIPNLNYHRADTDGTFRIGALCTHADLEKSSILAQYQPTLAATAPLVADPIVRTRGTFVGSVCHADPQGDWSSAMIALDGSIIAQGPKGRRTIAVRDFVTGPFQNALASNEIAIEAVIPPAKGIRAGGYLKLERRIGDFATAGVAVALEFSGASVIRAGIGLTGVGSATINAIDAAQSLVGSALTSQAIERAADLAAQAAQPRSDHRGSAAFKKQVVRTFVARMLTEASSNQVKAA